jgi:hypothetical protein
MYRVCVYRLRPPTVLSVLIALGPLSLGAALAQEAAPPKPSDSRPTAPAPARAVPRPDQLEPAVDTSRSAPAAAPSAAVGAAPDANAAGGARQPAAPGTVAARKEPPGSKASARKGADRLELDPTDITGNRELPKVLYIVPWKRSDLGDLVGKPMNSLLDDVLQPLDRDVFRRENRYYDALKPEPAGPKAGAAQGSGDKP